LTPRRASGVLSCGRTPIWGCGRPILQPHPEAGPESSVKGTGHEVVHGVDPPVRPTAADLDPAVLLRVPEKTGRPAAPTLTDEPGDATGRESRRDPVVQVRDGTTPSSHMRRRSHSSKGGNSRGAWRIMPHAQSDLRPQPGHRPRLSGNPTPASGDRRIVGSPVTELMIHLTSRVRFIPAIHRRALRDVGRQPQTGELKRAGADQSQWIDLHPALTPC